MKNIEDYVCTLAQAEKLKELGVEQDSLYWWNGTGIGMVTLNNEKADWSENILQYKSYSAFTSQELGEIIATTGTGLCNDMVKKSSDEEFYFFDIYDTYEHKILFVTNYAKTEAQARAEFLIYLLENKQ